MDKRFQKIGVMTPEIPPDCPVQVKEISLWLDTENSVLFMSPVMVNRYSDTLRELIIGYEGTDKNGNTVEIEHGYRIDDMEEVLSEQVFGEDMPITLQEENVVGGSFFIEEVTFADGYIWQCEKASSETNTEAEDPNVTTIDTIGGFGPEGVIFRKIPLSKVIAQRLTAQFVTTVIAIVMCVITLSQNIGIAMKSDKEMLDLLMSSREVTDILVSALEGEEPSDLNEQEYRDNLEKNGIAPMVRRFYVIAAVLLGASILYFVYLSFYLRETRKDLRENTVNDMTLKGIVKKLKTLSIIELVLCIVCAFSLFGAFAGFSGISTASMHKRIMKAKNNKQAEITK